MLTIDVLKSLKVLAKSRLISKAEATTVIRHENGPWKWPKDMDGILPRR